jgi:ketosteroid isomerase-like protein
MRRAIIPLFLLIATAAASYGAGVEDEIRNAEKSWAAAVKGRDFAALDKIFTPNLVYAHATGAIQTKKEYMDRLRTGKQRYDAITYESTKVFVYGDSAVAHSIMRMSGVNDAGPFNDHLMTMHFWVKQGGAWHLAAHQTTKLP